MLITVCYHLSHLILSYLILMQTDCCSDHQTNSNTLKLTCFGHSLVTGLISAHTVSLAADFSSMLLFLLPEFFLALRLQLTE